MLEMAEEAKLTELVPHPPHSDRRTSHAIRHFLNGDDSRERTRVFAGGYLFPNALNHGESSLTPPTAVTSTDPPSELLFRLSLQHDKSDTLASSRAAPNAKSLSQDAGDNEKSSLPSLAYSFLTADSLRGPRTISSDVLQARQVYGLDIPSLPQHMSVPVYACPLRFLSCRRTFFTPMECYEHSCSHFYGADFPKRVSCPFPSCTWSDDTSPNAPTAWYTRMRHYAEHCEIGEEQNLNADTARIKEQDLFQHLWRQRLIDDEELQDLRKYGTLRMAPKPGPRKVRQGKQKDEKSRRRGRLIDFGQGGLTA